MDYSYLTRLESFLTNRPFTQDAPCQDASLDEWIESLRHIGGIVGGERPSQYSQSPFLWNRLFQRLQIPGYFAPFDLPSGANLASFMETVLQAPLCVDLTITNPYKPAAYTALQELRLSCIITDRVHHLQSLNHILLQPDRASWFADSTDGEGMVRAIKKRLSLKGAPVLLVGSGGAATSIAYELFKEGAILRVVNIVEKDAHTLVERLAGTLANDSGERTPEDGGQLQKLPPSSGRPQPKLMAGGWDRIPQWAPESDVIISAITESTPLDRERIRKLPPSVILADTRYGEKAEFARLGRSLKHAVIDGKEMLFGQFVVPATRVARALGIPAPQAREALEEIEKEYLLSPPLSFP